MMKKYNITNKIFLEQDSNIIEEFVKIGYANEGLRQQNLDFALHNFDILLSPNSPSPEYTVLYEVGSGIGNIITTLPTIQAIAEIIGEKISIYHPAGKEFAALYKQNPYINKVYFCNESLTGISFDLYIKSSIARKPMPLVSSEFCLNLLKHYEYNYDGRFVSEVYFHYWPVAQFFKQQRQIELEKTLSVPKIYFNQQTKNQRLNRIGISRGKVEDVWNKRQWNNWKELLCFSFGDYNFVSYGHEEEYVENTINETGLSFEQTLISMRSCDLFIAADGGLCHVAEALGIPTIWLFGPTGASKNGPVSMENQLVVREPVHCSPCLYSPNWFTCKENVCMRSIKSEDLHTKVDKFLKSEFRYRQPDQAAFNFYLHDLRQIISPSNYNFSKLKPEKRQDQYHILKKQLIKDDFMGIFFSLASGMILLEKGCSSKVIQVLPQELSDLLKGQLPSCLGTLKNNFLTEKQVGEIIDEINTRNSSQIVPYSRVESFAQTNINQTIWSYGNEQNLMVFDKPVIIISGPVLRDRQSKQILTIDLIGKVLSTLGKIVIYVSDDENLLDQENFLIKKQNLLLSHVSKIDDISKFSSIRHYSQDDFVISQSSPSLALIELIRRYAELTDSIYPRSNLQRRQGPISHVEVLVLGDIYSNLKEINQLIAINPFVNFSFENEIERYLDFPNVFAADSKLKYDEILIFVNVDNFLLTQVGLNLETVSDFSTLRLYEGGQIKTYDFVNHGYSDIEIHHLLDLTKIWSITNNEINIVDD